MVQVGGVCASHGHVFTDDLQCLASHSLKPVLPTQAFGEHPLQEGEAVHEAWGTVVLLLILIRVRP